MPYSSQPSCLILPNPPALFFPTLMPYSSQPSCLILPNPPALFFPTLLPYSSQPSCLFFPTILPYSSQPPCLILPNHPALFFPTLLPYSSQPSSFMLSNITLSPVYIAAVESFLPRMFTMVQVVQTVFVRHLCYQTVAYPGPSMFPNNAARPLLVSTLSSPPRVKYTK